MSEEPWALFNRVYIESGWQRFLPPSAIEILPLLAVEGPVSRRDLDEQLRQNTQNAEGLESGVWESLVEYTDEELEELNVEFEGTPFERKDSEPQTADEVNTDEQATRQRTITELESFSSHLGLPTIQTLADLLAFITAAGVILLTDGKYSINPEAPLPEEALPLSEARREEEARLRWSRIHEGLAQKIIALFKPAGPYSINSMSTTIIGLAKSLEADPQSVREALVVLLNEGDFSVSDDPLRIAADELFQVQVDWEAFHSTRFSLEFGTPEDE